MVTRRPIRVYSNIGPQLAAKRPAVSSSRRRRSPRRPRPRGCSLPPSRRFPPPTYAHGHSPTYDGWVYPRQHPPAMPEHRGRRPGRRLVAAGEVGGQVGAQGHQSTAAEGMARPSRRRCRRAEPSAAGRGNLRPACAGQKLWPPMEAGRAGGRGPGGGLQPAGDPGSRPTSPAHRPAAAGREGDSDGWGRSAHPVPARGAPAARPAICERAGGAAVAERRGRGEVGWGRGGWRSKRRVLL